MQYSKGKNVTLVITYSDPKIKKIAESLQRNGYNVTLLLWERGWSFIADTNSCYEIRRLKIKNAPFGSLISAFYFPIWWAFLIINLIKLNSDIYHAVNFDSSFITIMIAKIKKKPVIYDIFDFYPDTINLPLPILTKALLRRIDRWIMKLSDYIIIVDESRIEQMGNDLNRRVSVIYNSPKEKVPQPGIRDREETIILYGGGVGKDRGIEDVINAVRDIRDVKLIVMGYCGDPRFARKLANLCKDQSNVSLILKPVSHEEIITATVNSDILFALYDPIVPNNRYASPNKLFEAMACGKPILVSDKTSMVNLVRKYSLGIIVPYGDVNAIRNEILRLKNSPQLRYELGRNGLLAFDKIYSWDIMEKKLLKIYEELAPSVVRE